MATETIEATSLEDLQFTSADAHAPRYVEAIEWSENLAAVLHSQSEGLTELSEYFDGLLQIAMQARELFAQSVEGDLIETLDNITELLSQVTTDLKNASHQADELGPAGTEVHEVLLSFQEAAAGHRAARGRVLDPAWLDDDD